MRYILLLLLSILPVFAQPGSVFTQTGVPPGSCIARDSLRIIWATGDMYVCSLGAWVLASGGGGGGGTVTSITATSPIVVTPSPLTTTGVISCPTCGTGTVTSVAETFTGGLISVAGSPITTSGTFALTVAGTSGGIPYFSSGTTWASSAALTAHGVVIGGGPGVAPTSTTAGIAAYVLTSNGASADPTFQPVPASTSYYAVAAQFTDQRVIGEGTAAIDFGSISNAQCDTGTFTFYGAVPDDVLSWHRPAGLAAGMQMTAWVSDYSEITIQLCNLTGGAEDPAELSYGVSIIR